MRNLLNTASQRIFKILEILREQEDWITINELSVLIGASQRTTAGDINILQKRWGPQLKIEVSTKNGVRMCNRSVAAIGAVFIDLFNESTTLRWLEEILFYPRKGIEFYEERLFVSRSTLLRQLPKINRILGERKMSVLTKNNCYEIIGQDEQYLRQFYAGFLLELYGLNLQKHHIDLDLAQIAEIIRQILAENLDAEEISYSINSEVVVAYYMMFYIVSLIRENCGYQFSSNHKIEKEINEKNLKYIKQSFQNISEDNLRPIHEFIVNQYHGWDSSEEEELVASESRAFFQRVLTVMDISVDKHTLKSLQYALKSIYLTVKFRPYATSVLFDRIYIFSLSVKKSNAPVYQLIQDHLELFSQKIHRNISRQLPDVLYWTSLICPAFTSYTATKSALVISDFGLQHAMYLAKRISSFTNENNVAVIQTTAASYPDGLTSVQLNEYDIIISTVSNLSIEHKNILLINDYPSYKNFYEIYQSCLLG